MNGSSVRSSLSGVTAMRLSASAEVPSSMTVLNADLHDDRGQEASGQQPGRAPCVAAPELRRAVPEPLQQIAPPAVLNRLVFLVLAYRSLQITPARIAPGTQPTEQNSVMGIKFPGLIGKPRPAAIAAVAMRPR